MKDKKINIKDGYAVLVIDAQKGFVTNPKCKEAIENIKKLVGKFDPKKVIFTKFFNSENSMHRKLMGWDRFEEKDTEERELALTPPAGSKILESNYDNKFFDENLISYLEELGISKLLICGTSIECGIFDTLRGAFDKGFEGILVEDCTASTIRKDHKKYWEASKQLLSRHPKTEIISSYQVC